MSHARFAALVLSCLSFSFLAGCASNVDETDLHAIGHAEIVYVRPATNLTATSSNAPPSAAAGAIGGFMTGLLNGYADSKEASSLNTHAGLIDGLKFNDPLYSEFSAVVAATPWLSGSTIKTISAADIQDEGDYTRKSTADSVVYLEPVFYMLIGNQFFNVDVKVLIQKADRSSTNHTVHTIAKQEFAFKHKLSLLKPGMSWDQQKDLAHEVAAMNFDQALDAWFADNDALIDAAFSQDAPQIDQGLRVFFGAKPAVADAVQAK